MIIKFLLFLLLPMVAFAAPPARQNSYTPNTTIAAADVTANENAIFNYLQAGVDSYVDGSIYNTDINSAANIQSDKLNLTSIAQSVANTGTFANTGNVTITGNITVSGTNNIIPSGVIAMWSGSSASIPTGWVLCNGSNSTPDLRDRFVIGATSTYAVGDSGGASTINIAHTHTATTSAPTTGGDAAGSGASGSNPTHVHTLTTASSLSATQSILPPYYALCFIMKS